MVPRVKSLARILSSTRELLPFYVGIIFSSVTIAALGLVNPFILKKATDTIVDAVKDPSLVNSAEGTIMWLAIALLVAYLTNVLVTNIGGFVGDVMAARMKQILSTRYFARLLSLPQGYFDNQVTGTIIARLDRSITSITQFLQAFSNNFFPMLITVTAVLIISGAYYWPLAILLAVIFPVYMWLTALTSKKWQKLEGQKNEQIDLAGGRFAEVVGQIKVVKSFISEPRELNIFGGRYGRTVELTKTQSSYWHRMDFIRGVVLNTIFFGIYFVLFYRTLHGYFTIGDMVLLIQLVTMARQPVLLMSFVVDTAQKAIAGSVDYFKVMDEVAEPTANKQLVAATTAADVPHLDERLIAPLQPTPGEPVISFQDVSFSYEEGEEVIHQVNFDVFKGQRIALVGESGGGKTTLVNLLLGLYRPTGGSMQLCGHPIEDLSAEKLRASVGVVFQEASLFSGTIRENIAYGKPDATEEEIIGAATRANADRFIRKFADGYDTTIGERGLRLSGGQKQRIAVARAMLKDAPVLVLDEATSALDTKSEQAVQRGLDELMQDRTTMIIAHRLSTIATVDTIITLKNGHVDEIGSPAELATSGGIYAELLALTQSQSKKDRKRLKAFGFGD